MLKVSKKMILNFKKIMLVTSVIFVSQVSQASDDAYEYRNINNNMSTAQLSEEHKKQTAQFPFVNEHKVQIELQPKVSYEQNNKEDTTQYKVYTILDDNNPNNSEEIKQKEAEINKCTSRIPEYKMYKNPNSIPNISNIKQIKLNRENINNITILNQQKLIINKYELQKDITNNNAITIYKPNNFLENNNASNILYDDINKDMNTFYLNNDINEIKINTENIRKLIYNKKYKNKSLNNNNFYKTKYNIDQNINNTEQDNNETAIIKYKPNKILEEYNLINENIK